MPRRGLRRGHGGPAGPQSGRRGALSTVTVTIAGSSKIWGFEFESHAAVTEKLEAGFNFDFAGNKFTSLFNNAITPYANFSNVKGNRHPRFPKWSGSGNFTYTDNLTANWEWFFRGDVNYFGKTMVDMDNLAKCDSYVLTNARIGIQRDDFNIEFFGKNILNESNWNTCIRFSEFDLPLDLANLVAYQAIIVTPQNKRQFGIRTSIQF